MSHLIEPNLGQTSPTFVYDYPASQAALARLAPDGQGVVVAQRFELYINGLEIANGYHELCDAEQQRQRFAIDSEKRKQRGLPAYCTDERLLAALDYGLPNCAGVALGIERLLMVLLKATQIDEVICFSASNA